MDERLRAGGIAEARSVILVAVVYLYFLVFAQFGFLKLLESGEASGRVLASMGLMAVGGMLGSALAGAGFQKQRARGLLGGAFLGAALAALAAVALRGSSLVVVAFTVGLSTGLLTVSLVGWLGLSVSPSRIGRVCGLGTGLGYAGSNLPFLFLASGRTQAIVVALVSLLGCLLLLLPPVGQQVERDGEEQAGPLRGWGTVLVVVSFTLLVWLDSAAFRVIQTDAALRAASWAEAGDVWMIGLVHLLIAVWAGWWMDRNRLEVLLLAAPLMLAAGYWGMRGAFPGSSGGWVYAAGVSLYSVPLVAVMLQRSDAVGAARRAGWLFAIAGWAGSALGIGMADDLGHVPLWFWGLAFAGLLGCGFGSRFVNPVRRRLT